MTACEDSVRRTCVVEHLRCATPGYPPVRGGGYYILRTKVTLAPDNPCPEHMAMTESPVYHGH